VQTGKKQKDRKASTIMCGCNWTIELRETTTELNHSKLQANTAQQPENQNEELVGVYFTWPRSALILGNTRTRQRHGCVTAPVINCRCYYYYYYYYYYY